jgi:hypothetical protein
MPAYGDRCLRRDAAAAREHYLSAFSKKDATSRFSFSSDLVSM